MAGKFYDCRFEKYNGAKRFFVNHPAHQQTLTVAAPDADAATVAAADYWGERWQSYQFYPYCTVAKA